MPCNYHMSTIPRWDHVLGAYDTRIARISSAGLTCCGWRSLQSMKVLGGLPLAILLFARGGSFFSPSRPTLPFTGTLVLRMRCSRVGRFLSEYPTFDFQLSTFNLPARVFLRFLTPCLAVHEYLSSPHPVQPSAEIPLRISCFRLSTCRLLTSPRGLSSSRFPLAIHSNLCTYNFSLTGTVIMW